MSNMTSSITLDPKMAAEHLGGFVANTQAYNMDALGFQYLQPATLKPGVVKKKSRNRDGEYSSYQAPRVESPQQTESYEEDMQEEDEEQEPEEYEDEPLEDQSKGSSSIASLESKYARVYNQEVSHKAAEPVSVERNAPTSVVSNVSAPYPRYTPKVRTNNYQDQYVPTSSTNLTAPAVVPSSAGSAPYPKWTPPASLKSYQEINTTVSQELPAPPQPMQARPPSHSIPSTMGNGYSKYQANQFPSTHEEEPQVPSNDEVDPQSSSTPIPVDPRNVPGQAGYKWQPPALLKQFQDTNDDVSQTDNSPPYHHPSPVFQSQNTQSQVVTPQVTPQGTLRPVSPEFIMWSKCKPFHVIMNRIESDSLECDPTIVTESGLSLCHIACEVGNVQLCLYLLNKYGPKSILSKYSFVGLQPLHVAAQFGQIQIFIELSHIPGCAPFFQELTQRTQDNLFHICAKYNQHSLLNFLCSSNLLPRSDLRKFNGQGQSPLHLACHFGFDASMQLLLSFPESDILEANQQKMSSLDVICSQGHLNLLRHLHTVYLPTQPSAVLAVLQNVNEMGFTCLHTACQYQQYHIVDYLINAAKVNPEGANGQSKKPSDVVVSDLIYHLLYGRMKAIPSSSSVPVQNKSPSSLSNIEQSSTNSKFANGVIETESQSLSQSPWANVALRKSSPPTQDSKFKSKPYVPPTNVSFLPPKANSEDKLALARERSLNKMKTKKNDSWMKPKTDEEIPTESIPTNQSEPISTNQPESISKNLTDMPLSSVPGSQPRTNALKYSSIEMDSSSDESDEDEVTVEKESPESEPIAEPEVSTFSKVTAWFGSDENLFQVEDYFGVGDHLKEDVNAIRELTTNETLLHRACSSGSINLVQCLVEGAGSDVNAVDYQGSSPLHYAIRSFQPLIAKYLIKKCGSDLTLRDCNDLTPLGLCTQLLNEVDGDNQAIMLDIHKVLEKYENKSIEKRLKITQPVYQPPESVSSP